MGLKIFNGMGAIVGFLFSVLLIQTIFDDKAAERYTVLLLIIVLLKNSGKLDSFFEKLFSKSNAIQVNTTNSQGNVSTVHTSENGRVHGGSSKSF